MVQKKIRIQSNPYTKQVKYYWKNDGKDETWTDLSENKNSPFARSNIGYKEFAEATIGHKAYEILNVINKTYNKGKSGIQIIVEGTKDDREELDNVIKTSFPNSGMSCTLGDMYMLTAKEAMPKIEEVYSSLGQICSKYSDDEISELIARYLDTVKPEISVCVVGLYSSGKSSFINSLIGKEILPSASDPVTAKIYKINCEDTSWVAFQFDGKLYRLEFLDDDWKINTSPDADLVNKIVDAVKEESNGEKRLYKALKALNEFAIKEGKERQKLIENMASEQGLEVDEFLDKNPIKSLLEEKKIEEYRLADLIEIGVAFSENTLLPIKDFKFVIFDTPGSNSEMHKEHVEILKRSLEDRTNGLPIFVTNPDTLDNTDNAPVIKMIDTMGKALDGTNTMIIVNKADEKSKNTLIKKQEKVGDLKVTSWKPSRIYFTSSIISLGEKIENPRCEESWIDGEYAYTYHCNYKKFDGSDERSLLELYKYNIVPQNIKDEVEERVKKCSRDELILWNTGIRSIECEIAAFGEKFALYNKCAQAEKYLDEAINRLSEKISRTADEIEKSREQIESSIAHEIKELVEKMRTESEAGKSKLDNSFQSDVVGPYVQRYLDTDRIRGLMSGSEDEAKKNSFEWKEHGFKPVRNANNYVEYVKKIVSRKYDEDIEAYTHSVNETSDRFWNDGIEGLKDTLLQVVYGSSNLTEEQKKIARDTVMEAGKMESFHKELNLEVGYGIKKKSFLWVINWNEFDSDAASESYKGSLKDVIEGKNDSIKLENTKAFRKWKDKLIDLLEVKLSQLNPEVVKLNKKLVHNQKIKEELDEQLKEVTKAQYDIRQLLSFREVE